MHHLKLHTNNYSVSVYLLDFLLEDPRRFRLVVVKRFSIQVDYM